MSVCDLLTELVINASGDEFGKRADERDLPGYCQTGGYANHIGLCNSALDEALRELGCKGVHLERAFEVGRESQYIFIFTSCQNKTLAETAAGIYLACINILLHTNNLLKFLVTASKRPRTALLTGPFRATCGFRP